MNIISNTISAQKVVDVVGNAGIDEISIANGQYEVKSGDKVQLTATGVDIFDNPVIPLSITWTSGKAGDTGAGSISASGLFTGEKIGSVTIFAASNNKQ